LLGALIYIVKINGMYYLQIFGAEIYVIKQLRRTKRDDITQNVVFCHPDDDSISAET